MRTSQTVCNLSAKMDIWTERLERRHLPLLKNWIGRTSGMMTPNDLPEDPAGLPAWYENRAAEPDRLDCLISVYETPVGVSGLRKGQDGSGEFYLLLGETNYNPLRTATYATLRMLDRAFDECGCESVRVRAFLCFEEYREALERMGFSGTGEEDGLICAEIRKQDFLSRKYLS